MNSIELTLNNLDLSENEYSSSDSEEIEVSYSEEGEKMEEYGEDENGEIVYRSIDGLYFNGEGTEIIFEIEIDSSSDSDSSDSVSYCGCENDIVEESYLNKMIGKDCMNIIIGYKEDMESDFVGSDICVGKCEYCKERDLLYVNGDNDSDNDMCYKCWGMVKDGKGWIMCGEEEESEDWCEENDFVSPYEFMNDMDYTWIENEEKWYSSVDCSYCDMCRNNRKSDMVKGCSGCDNNCCCGEVYIECCEELLCMDCFDKCGIIEEDENVKCCVCKEGLKHLDEECGVMIYQFGDFKMCGDCVD